MEHLLLPRRYKDQKLDSNRSVVVDVHEQHQNIMTNEVLLIEVFVSSQAICRCVVISGSLLRDCL